MSSCFGIAPDTNLIPPALDSSDSGSAGASLPSEFPPWVDSSASDHLYHSWGVGARFLFSEFLDALYIA
jgi:hypothetical protein